VEHEGLFTSVTVLPLDISEKPNSFGSENVKISQSYHLFYKK